MTDVYRIVTDQVIAALEAGTVPWHRPWNAETGLPRSLASGKGYRGVNPFLLGVSAAAHGYEAPWWITYKQATDRGGYVRKGERSSLVVFWRRLDPKVRTKRDPETGEELSTLSAGMVLRHFNVFNVEQCAELDYPKAERECHEWDPLAACEGIAAGYLTDGPQLVSGGSRACYVPSQDTVRMPERDRFTTAEGFYSTLFHELTHSTGHRDRLARPDLLDSHAFGDASYSREELVAEMGAAMLCGVAGIDQVTVPQSAAYVASWLRQLRGDSRLVVVAAAQAQRAADLIRHVTYATEEAAA